MSKKISRRSLIGTSARISAGVAAGLSLEHRALMAQLVDRKDYGSVQEPVDGLQVGTFGGREEGFRHAFERGADFIAVGMFDWQTRDDAACAKKVLAEDLQRNRNWHS